MPLGEVCHFWLIVGLDPFLRFRPLFGSSLVELLGGILTYAHLVGADYKVIGVDHSIFYECLFAFFGLCETDRGFIWPFFCFETSWDHASRLHVLKQVRAMLADYVL